MEKKFNVTGMSCSHCEDRVKKALIALGANPIKVSAKENEVVVSWEGPLSMEAIVATIEDAGYDVVL